MKKIRCEKCTTNISNDLRHHYGTFKINKKQRFDIYDAMVTQVIKYPMILL